MKQLASILILLFLSCHFLNAQKIKQKQAFVKSSGPIEGKNIMDFEINATIDSTIISKETYSIIKEILPLVEKEQHKEALNLVNAIDQKDLETNQLLVVKAILEMKLDELSNSYNSFSKYIPLAKNDSIRSSVYYSLGMIDIKRHLQISASHNFEKSLELDNRNLSTIIALEQLNFAKKDFDKAIFYCEKALKINPNLNNVWNNLGFIYQQKENHKEAQKIFSKIIKDEPEDPLPYNNRSYSNLKLGFTKQAMEDVNKSLKLFPENSYAYRNRALIYLNLKDAKKACLDIETAFKLGYREKYGSDLDLIQSENCKN
ncbi:tetratricopeptide repeat protein [uncultured Flavobacterium sp.]|uniref:tetratricopeptide repeat protein n=1 Tax=uncultured Flavobacterium sp. TaxID=165435 RepID=UPI003081D24C